MMELLLFIFGVALGAFLQEYVVHGWPWQQRTSVPRRHAPMNRPHYDATQHAAVFSECAKCGRRYYATHHYDTCSRCRGGSAA